MGMGCNRLAGILFVVLQEKTTPIIGYIENIFNVILELLAGLSGVEFVGKAEGKAGEIELPEAWSGLKSASNGQLAATGVVMSV
jgi:hypothetical protein